MVMKSDTYVSLIIEHESISGTATMMIIHHESELLGGQSKSNSFVMETI